MKLRVNGIYRLPNDRELVVTSEHVEDGFVIYTLENLDSTRPFCYSVRTDGRLSSNGNLTAWDLGDLEDTGLDSLRQTA